MFSDIVGSTALFSSVSPKEADRLRQRHFQVLDAALATAGGRLVKNLGDGAMAVFGSASQALSCAVMLQQSVLSDREESSEPIVLRIGLSTGDVTREQEDYFGDAVVEAARLCALAEPGQILVTAKVRVIAGRYAMQSFEPLGEKMLKGLPDPVEVEEVRWSPAPAFEFPPPPRLKAQLDFFGRARELALVEEAFKWASSGSPQVAFFAGEAGIGKTALATAFAFSAHERGAIVLLGRCDEHLRAPFQPFEEALGHYVAHAPEQVLSGYVRVHGADLLRVVPELGRRLPGIAAPASRDPESERHAFFRAVTALLSMGSATQPIVLILDDLHWADEDSLHLLRHVASTREGGRLLVLCTYRSTELASSHPLSGVLGALSREIEPVRINLEGWGHHEIASFIEPGADASFGEEVLDLAALLAQETGGNPFFVTEMLHHLSASGSLRRQADRWIVSGPVSERSLPASVREVLAQRMHNLGPKGEEILQTASLIGRDFGFELLAHATGLAEEELLDVLDLATTEALIREAPLVGVGGDSVFTFHQAVIRTALQESIGPSRRMVLHRRIGERLEEMAGAGRKVAPADLAYHFGAAGAAYGDKGLRYLVEAAEDALNRLAPKEAVKHFAAAISLAEQLFSEDEEQRLRLLISIGTAQRLAGMGEYRQSLLDAARLAARLGDSHRLVEAALANTRGFTSVTGRVDTELVDVLERAVASCDPRTSERALVLAALCSELQYDPDVARRRALARETEEICASLADEQLAVTVANRMFTSVQTSYTLAELLQKTESTLRAAERAGDDVQLFWALMWRTYALRSAGSLREADFDLAKAASIASELDQPLLIWWAANVAAVGAWLEGDCDKTEQLAGKARKIGVLSGQPDAALLSYALEGGATWMRGRLGQNLPFLTSALAANPGETGIFVSQLLACVEADDVEGCRKGLEGVDERIAGFASASDLLINLTILAEAAICSKDVASAEVIFAHLVRYGDHVAHTGVSTTGPVSHYLGGLAALGGRLEDAEQYYARAAIISEAMPSRFFGARTALGHATALMARAEGSDMGRARQFLETACQLGAAGGYGLVAARAEAALAMFPADGEGAGS